MKKLLLTAAAILATLNMYGQGTFQGAVDFISTGSGKYVRDPSGNLAAGSAYRVALYWGRGNETDDRNLTQIGNSVNMSSGLSAGYFNGFGRTITYDSSVGTLPGAILAFQVRGWATRNGTLLTWDAAIAAGSEVGKTDIFTMDSADPAVPTDAKPSVGTTPGYTGFTIVPEPSVYALGLLGVGALLMLRRRK